MLSSSSFRVHSSKRWPQLIVGANRKRGVFMLRWPLASSARRLPAPRPGRLFLLRNDHMHASRILPKNVHARPDRNARTAYKSPPRRQIAITDCTDIFFPSRTIPVSLVHSKARAVWMNPAFSQVLEAFLRRYAPGAPSRPSYVSRENLQLTQQHGLRLLGPAPATDIMIGAPPTSRSNSKYRYLWVIDEQGILHIIEEYLDVLDTTLPKHTNLTGGGNACIGGEMWFASNTSVYVSGGSGRYPPKDSRHLDAAVEVFGSLGYEVISLGWDEVTGFAKRHWE